MMSNTAGILEQSSGGIFQTWNYPACYRAKSIKKKTGVAAQCSSMFLPQWLLLVEGAGETGVTLTADLENWKYYHDLLLLLIYILVKLDHPTTSHLRGGDCLNFIFAWSSLRVLGQQWLGGNKHFEGHEYQIGVRLSHWHSSVMTKISSQPPARHCSRECYNEINWIMYFRRRTLDDIPESWGIVWCCARPAYWLYWGSCLHINTIYTALSLAWATSPSFHGRGGRQDLIMLESRDCQTNNVSQENSHHLFSM